MARNRRKMVLYRQEKTTILHRASTSKKSTCQGKVMQRRNGFTLIELLVVIAIIALLMAILMPVLGKAKEQARTMVCRSNLKQYGIGLRMYLDENDYFFPQTDQWMKSTTSGWVKEGEIPDGQLWPYIKALDCHMCPRFAHLKKGTNYEDTKVSYVLNSYVGRGGSIWSSWLGSDVTGVTKEPQVYHPSKVITFTEENTWTIEGYSNYPFNDTHFTVGNWTRQIDNYATFHNAPGDIDKGGANIVFVDGHVELLPRVSDLDEGFRLAWPKKNLPY
jgi:prepilin-type N-terminal cleavage/methylation domain-containing protein/prepilin-type processing-associated H-X9-DG protein